MTISCVRRIFDVCLAVPGSGLVGVSIGDVSEQDIKVPGNIHSGVSGNDSIVATGVFSAQELLRVTRCEGALTSRRPLD